MDLAVIVAPLVLYFLSRNMCTSENLKVQKFIELDQIKLIKMYNIGIFMHAFMCEVYAEQNRAVAVITNSLTGP